MSKHSLSSRIHTLVGLAILSAIVVVLQLFCIIPINPVVSITLSLIPIVVGAIIYGPWAGAFLGTVLGGVIFVLVVQGSAGALSTAMFNFSPVATFLVCILKTALAGFLSGLVYKLLTKSGHEKIGIIVASLLCPFVNTGIFVTALLTIFGSIASASAESSGVSLIYFIIVMIVGINFVVEFAINGLLAPVVVRIIGAVKKTVKAR